MKWVEWNEPLWGKGGQVLGNSIVRAAPKDVIAWRRFHHMYGNLMTDEDILDDFMVTHYAWFKEYPDEYQPG